MLRVDRVILQSTSTSKWRLARHWFSTPGTINPDQHRAWRLCVLAELFPFNLQTGLVHRGWDGFLVYADILLGFARAHHPRVSLAHWRCDVCALFRLEVPAVRELARPEARNSSRTFAGHHGLCSCQQLHHITLPTVNDGNSASNSCPQ